MGLMDKLKNIFTEEVEDDEVKVEEIKKEVRSVPISSPTVERRETKKTPKKIISTDVEENDKLEPIGKKEETKSSPVFFTERDFEDMIEPRRRVDKYEKTERHIEEKRKEEEKPKPYGGNYNNNTIIQKEKITFKPTPIISPVYGILDKNYHKEDIVERKENSYEVADGLSVDSIRNKAYGTLEDEIEEVMTSTPKKKSEAVEDVDLFDELEEANAKDDSKTKKEFKDKKIKEIEDTTIDLTQELDNLLMSKKKYNSVKDDNDKATKEKLAEDDLFNLIDSMYEEGE